MKMNLKLNYDRLLYVSFALILVACESSKRDSPLYLPDGFEATVFVDSISETVRHMAVIKMEIYMPNSNVQVRQG